MNIQDLLGAVAQSGVSQSTSTRIKNSLGGGGLLDSLAGMLGGASGGTGGGLGGALGGILGAAGGSQGGGLGGLGGALGGLGGMLGGASRSAQGGGALGGGVLGNILAEAGKAVGGNQNLALGGLGALAGALLGGGKKSAGGALGGGLMALLGAIAFQALKSGAGRTPAVPLGLAAPQTKAQEAELERNSELVLKAMINAAKADGKIDQNEIKKIVGKVQEAGVDSEAQAFLAAEMKKPMETAALIKAAQGKPGLAAQLYSASLLAIEVDTPAEQSYLGELAAGLGLKPEVVQNIHQVVGLAG